VLAPLPGGALAVMFMTPASSVSLLAAARMTYAIAITSLYSLHRMALSGLFFFAIGSTYVAVALPYVCTISFWRNVILCRNIRICR